MVVANSNTIAVHLGPMGYMERQEHKFQKGDKVTITGFRIIYDGVPAMVPAMIDREGMKLRLHDQDGYPVWRGWRKGKNMNE